MGRPKGSTKVETRRLQDHCVKPRTCLRCSQEFMSRGPGNRICAGCAKKLDALSAAGRLGKVVAD